MWGGLRAPDRCQVRRSRPTSRLPITNHGKSASDRFRLADQSGASIVGLAAITDCHPHFMSRRINVAAVAK
jgi:hypothetical protein